MILRWSRTGVLWLATAVTLAASGVALWESYHGLEIWALGHRVEGPQIWPLCVDAFIVLGECALFLAMHDNWSGWARIWPWTVLAGGLAVSVAANMGHARAVTMTDRLTFAVPPLAAFVGMTVGLGILKRVVADTATAARPRPRPRPATAARPRGWKAAAAIERVKAGFGRWRKTAAAAELVDDAATGAPRPSTAAPARAIVAELVGKGITDTRELAQLTGVAERTARRYRTAATAAAPPAGEHRRLTSVGEGRGHAG